MKLRDAIICLNCDEIFDSIICTNTKTKIFMNWCPSCGSHAAHRLCRWIPTMNEKIETASPSARNDKSPRLSLRGAQSEVISERKVAWKNSTDFIAQIKSRSPLSSHVKRGEGKFPSLLSPNSFLKKTLQLYFILLKSASRNNCRSK